MIIFNFQIITIIFILLLNNRLAEITKATEGSESDEESIINNNEVLLIKMRPEFIEQPVDTYIAKNSANIKCSVKNAISFHIECNNKIYAFKNETNNTDYSQLNSLNVSIKRKDVIEFKQSATKSKHFTCICIANGDNNGKITSKKAIIRNSFLDEEFQSDPIDETTYDGDTVELRCDPPRGDPQPLVYWLKNDVAIDTSVDSSRYKVSNDNSLLILVVNKYDSGTYVCVAHSSVDKRYSRPAKLTVLDGDGKYVWSEWSEWSFCSVPCGEGIIRRTRACQNLISSQNVSDVFCSDGHSLEEEPCMLSLCTVVEAHWSEWQQWSMCTSECKQYRKRNCILPNGEITDDKDCEKAERLQIRNCTTTKFCKSKFGSVMGNSKINDVYEETTLKVPFISPLEKSNEYFMDKNMLSFIIGITSGILILIICAIVIALILKRKTPKKEEHNIYYTCESSFNDKNKKSKKSAGYFKGSFNAINQHIQENKGVLIFNPSAERQLLLNNISQTQNYEIKNTNNNNNSNTTNADSTLFYTQNNEYEQASPIVSSRSLLKSSLTNVQTQLSDGHKESPTNFTTTTTLDTGTSTSSSSYYATPSNEFKISNGSNSSGRNSSLKGPNKGSHRNPVRFDINTINSRKRNSSCKFNNSVLLSAYSTPSLVSQLDSCRGATPGKDVDNDFDYISKHFLLNNASKSTPNLINNLLNNIIPSDICVETIGSTGAKLTLDCGITLLVPEGAIPAEQIELIYLAVCRHESSKPKLNDRASSLSTVIVVGPSTVALLKPVMLIVDHCILKANEDWNISLFTSQNDETLVPVWTDELNDKKQENRNIFLNVTDKHFILMSDRLCRYTLTGESKYSNHIASKLLRLVACCSSCLTSNHFNLRIYCVDDLFVSLQEILRDEEKIDGIIMSTSEPFPLSYLNAGDAICINVDEFSEDWNCKYNVNKQEIPVNHIWNGRNHLLHCSFTLERQNSLSERFNCKVKVFQKCIPENNPIVLDINYYGRVNSLKYSNSLTKNSIYECSWLRLYREANLEKSLRLYSQIDKNLKLKISELLGDTYKILAEKLSINKNFQYFGSKKSPADTLLLYFEAINYLRTSNITQANVEMNLNKNNEFIINQYYSNEMFSNYFLNFFTQQYSLNNFKNNNDDKNSFYANN